MTDTLTKPVPRAVLLNRIGRSLQVVEAHQSG